MPIIGLQSGAAGVIKNNANVVIPPVVPVGRGRPTVSGNTILTDQGTRLRGCTFGLDAPGSLATTFTTNIDNWNLIKSKKLNCIRLDVTLSSTNTTLATQLPYIDTAVENAAKSGMYIIIMCSSGQLTYNKPELIQFWSTVAARYKDKTHVFYEITNEPAWVYDGVVLQDMDDINEIILNAAPQSLIGVLDFVTLQDGNAPNIAASFAALGPTYAPIGRSYVCAHLYFNSTQAQLQTLKNSYPVFMTEHIWQSATENDSTRFGWCEAVGVSWVSWAGRCGRLSDIKDPRGTSLASLDRILNEMNAAGITWAADSSPGGTTTTPLADGKGLVVRQDGTGWMQRQDGGYMRRQEFVDPIVVVNPPPPPPPTTTNVYDPPDTWVKTFSDDFTMPAGFGPNSVDSTIWRQPNYGNGLAHNGSSYWNSGNNLEATGTSIKIHTKFDAASNTWKVDGFQAGYQNADPAGGGYFAGFQEFHYRFRARYSHAVAPGVGGYACHWPASNKWSSELDWMETPGDNKTRVDVTAHWDSRGLHDLNSNNEMKTVTVNNLDLTQFHIWDCRRTYALVNNVLKATVDVWIDGIKVPTPAEWQNNAYLTDAMMPGFAGYVAPNFQWAIDWYGLTKANTPSDSYMEIDYAYIWTPPAGSPTVKNITINPTSPGSISETSPGSGVPWSTNVTTDNVNNLTYQVFDSNGIAKGSPATLDMTTQVATSTATALDLPGAGGGQVGNIKVILQGQSNAVFWFDADGTYTTSVQFSTMVKQLCGLSDSQFTLEASRSDFTPAAATLFSGTYTYAMTGHPPEWLYPVGGTLADPSTWPNDDAMNSLKQFCTNNQGNLAANRPWILMRMHDEYDSTLSMQLERDTYEAANREFIKRWRSYMGGRPNNLLPVFQVFVPYGMNTRLDTAKAIRKAWRQEAADSAHAFYHGVGAVLDAQHRGDNSHWTQDSATRVARRMAIRIARWLYDNGYSANDLSWLPDFGPRIIQALRVVGDNTKLDLVIAHNKANDIQIKGTGNPAAFIVVDGSTAVVVNSISRVAADKIRLSLASALAPSGVVTVDYGLMPDYAPLENQITDNWSSITKPALAASVTNLNQDMPLARMRQEIIVGDTAGGTTTTSDQKTISIRFTATGDFLRIWETAKPSNSIDSDKVTIVPVVQTGRSITVNPNNPGSVASGTTVPMTVTTTGISSITWVLVNADYSWPNSGTVVPTNGQVTINPTYTASGQFVKILDTNDFTYGVDTYAVTIV